MLKNQLSGGKTKDYFMAHASFHGVITACVAPSVTGYRTRRRCPLSYSMDPTPADHREQTDSGTRVLENKSVNQDRVGRASLKSQSATRLVKCLNVKGTKEVVCGVRKEGEGE